MKFNMTVTFWNVGKGIIVSSTLETELSKSSCFCRKRPLNQKGKFNSINIMYIHVLASMKNMLYTWEKNNGYGEVEIFKIIMYNNANTNIDFRTTDMYTKFIHRFPDSYRNFYKIIWNTYQSGGEKLRRYLKVTKRCYNGYFLLTLLIINLVCILPFLFLRSILV